jgi:hypothetical protein
MALLRAGDLWVTEVCFAVGFSSLGSFSAVLRERGGGDVADGLRFPRNRGGFLYAASRSGATVS